MHTPTVGSLIAERVEAACVGTHALHRARLGVNVVMQAVMA